MYKTSSKHDFVERERERESTSTSLSGHTSTSQCPYFDTLAGTVQHKHNVYTLADISLQRKAEYLHPQEESKPARKKGGADEIYSNCFTLPLVLSKPFWLEIGFNASSSFLN